MDRQQSLDTLGEPCAKTDWQVHVLCLMDNHFHLVVETPRSNLVAREVAGVGASAAGLRREQLPGIPQAAGAALAVAAGGAVAG